MWEKGTRTKMYHKVQTSVFQNTLGEQAAEPLVVKGDCTTVGGAGRAHALLLPSWVCVLRHVTPCDGDDRVGRALLASQVLDRPHHPDRDPDCKLRLSCSQILPSTDFPRYWL